jgi:LmbE family N-acetylglucosaminyl deacetylase
MALLQELRHFKEMGSVLYVAAHPDDENTQLITYLARGRGYRTAYLSVTRGDGGQNVLGPEFGDELGVIRTQELLAARRLDGGRQFFTRAIDFGFSKTPEETLRIWDRQQVLSDIVRIIRSFRPDVVVTRFSPQGGGHGHHTASAILAVEAFKLAGDPKAFPEQLKELSPWQPKRIFWNGFNRQGGETAAIQMDISGEDPVVGESFSDIAGRSRSMHKTQGFGNFTGFGGRGRGREESFDLLAGDPATKDIMDGLDTTWNRVPGGGVVATLAEEAIAHFNTNDPSVSVPALLKLRAELAGLPHDPVSDDKRSQLDRILQQCLGLSVETMIPDPQVVPGETMHLRHVVTLRSAIPVRWVATRFPTIGEELGNTLELKPNVPAERKSNPVLPANTPLTEPYWLREEHPIGTFKVEPPELIGRPENPPAFPVEQVFEVSGQRLVVADEPRAMASTDGKEHSRRFEVIPPVWLTFNSDIALFAPGGSHAVEIEAKATRPRVQSEVRIETPSGWRVEPANRQIQIAGRGEHIRLTFNVTAPSEPATASPTAHARVEGRDFSSRRIDLDFPHIPPQLLQPAAQVKAVGLQLATRGRRVGYIPGAGDSVAECLQQMGYEVTTLNGPDLTPERLSGLDAVVVGVRAFNVRTNLSPQMPALFAYVEKGGNLIEQYNRPNDLKVDKLTPFSIRISSDRVTDENSPVTLLAPDHPALTVPNKIGDADFAGWIQERGLYFPNQWDEHFTPLLACSDPGEAPLRGGLLVAKYGQGYVVYSGLAWFRQLPGGVPGAYRLFANLVSLGKAEDGAGAGASK